MLSSGYWRIVKVVGLAVVAVCGCVTAGTIGPTGCLNNSCYGGQYSLDANLLPSGQNSDWWRITFSADLSGYNGPSSANYVASLAVKLVDSDSSILGVNNVSAPTNGTWKMVPGGASNSGCNGSGTVGSVSSMLLAVAAKCSLGRERLITPGLSTSTCRREHSCRLPQSRQISILPTAC